MTYEQMIKTLKNNNEVLIAQADKIRLLEMVLEEKTAEIEKNENIIRLADKTIQKQSAEIDELQLKIESCNSENAELKAENDTYKRVVGELQKCGDTFYALHDNEKTGYIPKELHKTFKNMAVSRAKAEAIKEFWNKLKTHSRKMHGEDLSGSFWDRVVLVEDGDNLVKEMTEGKE